MDENSNRFVLVKCFLALVLGSLVKVGIADKYFVRKTTDFKTLTEGIFVDKTLLITEVMKMNALVTTPPGFGKSVNLDMIRRYFELNVDTTTGELMELESTENYRLFTNKTLNLKVMRDTDFFKVHFGKYPIIFVNFNMTNGTNFEAVFKNVHRSMSECFKKYDWLFEGKIASKLMDDDRKFYQIIAKCEDNPIDDIYEYVTRSIHFLGHILNQHFNVKALLLIDDYDSPMITTVINGGDVRKTRELMDDILFNVLQQEPNVLEMAFVNGIFTMLRASGSCRSNINQYAFLCEHRFSAYYGFLEEEVIDSYFKPLQVEEEETKKLKRSYYGYVKDKKVFAAMYAPVDIVSYFYNKIEYHATEMDIFFVCGPMHVDMEIVIRNNYLREALIDFLWYRSHPFTLMSVVKDEDLEKLSSVLTETNKSRNAGEVLVLPYFYEHGLLGPGNSPGTFKIPNEMVRAYIRRFIYRYYFLRKPLDLVDSQLKLISLLTKITTYPSDIISPPELSQLESLISTYFRAFEHISITSYGMRATENDFKFLLYYLCYRVSKMSKWKYSALHQTPSGPKKRKIDIMLRSFTEIALFIRVRYSSYERSRLDSIELYRPVGRMPRQLKYLDVSIAEGLTIKARSAQTFIPSGNECTSKF